MLNISKQFISRILLISILAFGHLHASQHTDFLIIENPAVLKIYDRYQQELSAAEKSRRLAFAPLRIINERELLGDQITESIHVRLGSHDDYFIIKSNNGKMLNQDKAGQVDKLKNCVVVGDSIRIKKDGMVTLSTAAGKIKLSAGSHLIRNFKYKNRYYVYLPAPQKRYGWLTLNSNGAWELIKQKQTAKADNEFLSMDARSDILQVFKNVNRLYQKYFDFFNQKTFKHEQPPRWDVQIGGSDVQAVFIPDSLFNEFKESAAFTRRQLENALIGSPYRITMRNNRLIISKKGGE